MATKLVLLLMMTILCSLQCLPASSFEFQVGGSEGWVVPPANDSKIYNDWASENRFQTNDTIRFRYRKDSVMQVSEEDYKKCNSTHPNFFSNTGNTVFRFDHAGAYYFISGASGHCQKGQRMIVKVMSSEEASQSSHHKSSSSSSSSADPPSGLSMLLLVAPFVLSFLASYHYLF